MSPWPWVILGRVPRVVPHDAEAQTDADAQHAADFSIPVALPPRVTIVTAAPSAQVDPNYPDEYPYILAVDTGCLLFHFSADPSYGACFADRPRPYESNLVVVRQFHPDGVQQGRATTATAERISRRDGYNPIVFDIESIGHVSVNGGSERIPRPDGRNPIVFNIESIGLLSINAGADYTIAELMVDKGSERARLLYFEEGFNQWYEKSLVCPLSAEDREWVPSGVVAHEDKLWWFDLSWGILSYDPFVDDPVLLFHGIPQHRVLGMSRLDIHDHRCITESLYVLRYVEIIIPEGCDCGGCGCGNCGYQAATVTMCTRISAPDGGDETIGWEVEYEMSFAEIWNDDSYIATGLPQKVPVLAVVCPLNPDLVYFALQQRLFSVDVPEHRVVEFFNEDYDLGNVPWPAPASCRYVLPWFLPLEVAEALGMDPFDEDDELQPAENDDDLQQAAEIDGDNLQAAEINGDDDLQAAEIDDNGLQAGEVDDVQVQPEAEIDDDELQAEEFDGDDEMQEAEIDDDERQAAEFDGDDEMQEAEIYDDELQAGEMDDEERVKSDVTYS